MKEEFGNKWHVTTSLNITPRPPCRQITQLIGSKRMLSLQLNSFTLVFFLFSFPFFFFFPFFFLRPSRCISVARQMSLNARPGLPFQKLNVSSSVVSISTQADQLFSGLFNLSDKNMRLTLWHTPDSGNPYQIDRY